MTVITQITIAVALVLSIILPFGYYLLGEKSRGRYKTALGVNAFFFVGIMRVAIAVTCAGGASVQAATGADAGLATGMGYLLLAGILAVVICTIQLIFSFIKIGDKTSVKKELRITIPESLDYTGVFDELFEQYTKSNELVEVKTANIGSLYKLRYIVILKEQSQEKQFIDDLRCRNGNLEISCCRAAFNQETL